VAEVESRYLFFGQQVTSCNAIDVACGTGLGLRILRSFKPARLLGVDLSWSALSEVEGQSEFFLTAADGTALPLRSGWADVIVSFETIEHVDDWQAFLREMLRCLRSGGTLLLSTPNAVHSIHDAQGTPLNPFHKKEFTPEELVRVFSGYFETVETYGQLVPSSFGVCPFWQPRSAYGRGLRKKAKAALWKILVRLPSAVGPRLSSAILGQPLYPGAADFEFRAGAETEGHVFLLIGRNRRPLETWKPE
jgi:SAM-dependent methyltransferase